MEAGSFEKQNVISKKESWVSKAKGFGILGVVAVHSMQRFDLSETFIFSRFSKICFAGAYCVQLFFIISSYLTFLSLSRGHNFVFGKSYFKFITHKLFRFVPVLYFTVLIHSIFDLIQGKGLSYKNIFFALSFLNGFSIHHINPWLNWYIGDLVIFIIFSPMLFKFVDTLKKSVFLFFISVLISLFSTKILQHIGLYDGWYFYFWFPNQFPLLAFGILFYFFKHNSNINEKKNVLKILLFIFSFYYLFTLVFHNIISHHIMYGIFLLIFTYILFNRYEKYFYFLTFLGDLSYGIYLFHGLFLRIFDWCIYRYIDTNNSFCFCCFYLLLILISFISSKLFNEMIETPLFKIIKRFC